MGRGGMVAATALLGALAGTPADARAGEAEDWFFEDFEAKALAVNEGRLEFLAESPDEPVHHHHNELVLSASSLDDGWANLTQCHEHLDAVPRAEIVYNPEKVRGLTVESYTRIGRVWVEGDSVQLEDVEPGARLCVSAWSHALQTQPDGSYTVHNGPFMRKFLDGYYPMRVSMAVRLPGERLRFVGITPHEQSGFRVWQSAGAVHYEALFEGRLETEIRFRATH